MVSLRHVRMERWRALVNQFDVKEKEDKIFIHIDHIAGERGSGTTCFFCFTHGIPQCVHIIYFYITVQQCSSSVIYVFAHYPQSAAAVFCADSLFPNPSNGSVGRASNPKPAPLFQVDWWPPV